MRPNRSWMLQRKDHTGLVRKEFSNGVTDFMNVVRGNPSVADVRGRIPCPCARCRNRAWRDAFSVQKHLYDYGFVDGYENWTLHGEERWDDSFPTPITQCHDEENMNPYVEMVMDAAGDRLNEEAPHLEEDPNPSASKFYNMLRDADEPLWDGCNKHSKLSAVTQLLNLKSEYDMSISCYDRMIALIKSMLPESEKLPENFYGSKSMVRELGLGYEKIDACKHHCMLFYKEYSDASVSACLICGHPRFKPKTRNATQQKDVPYSVLRYFPIVPRLQRLFLSKDIARYMCWHLDGVCANESVMTHPADAEAWKKIDQTYPTFAQEPRNVRLGLCTDGFNPFGHSSTPYSCWPVFVTPYNLPPSMCMKREYIFLSLLIPGPRSPGKNLDVYLRPLIDELKMLWDTGVNTFDSWRRQNFIMKAALLWTISDFPAYGMLSGWSTHGKLACPYCMANSKSFQLKYGHKPCWFDCHRQFLSIDHPFRNDRNSFKKSTSEYTLGPKRLSGRDVFRILNELQEKHSAMNSSTQMKIPGFGEKHNWVRKSIFWELPYWPDNLIPNNLDPMHIVKNVFDNTFNTITDIKGKTKDNPEARKDLKMICRRPNLELIVQNGKGRKPKATYCLNANDRRTVFEWMKELKFPDGYASNISRCVNLDSGKIYGMKSHDCHVFMQRLIPLAFRHMLPKPIWGVLAELSLFFRQLCANEISMSMMEKAEVSIVETVCKMEKIFPPGFFDSMEHLVLHLPYEAKVGGPVQYRWMFPFERCMMYLKRKVKNRARVEGSIAEAYIVEEISNFTSKYFDPIIRTRRTQVPRNDDGGQDLTLEQLSCFKYPCRPVGRARKKFLTDEELRIAETYVLVNCRELEPYLEQFEDSLRDTNPNISEDEILEIRDKDFSGWLKHEVNSGRVENLMIRELSYGPSKSVMSYNRVIVNGYKFHTKKYGLNDLDYYGIVDDILELSYLGKKNKLILLQCHWFDPINGVKVDPRYGLVDINPTSRLQSNEPFVLAEQAQQVYYTKYPQRRVASSNEWWAACKVRPKLFVLETFNDAETLDNANDDSNEDDYYQEDVSIEMDNIVTENEVITLFDADAPMDEVDLDNIHSSESDVNDNESDDYESIESLDENEEPQDSYSSDFD